MKLVLTCEHASNAIPEAFKPQFAGDQWRLNSHEGYDPGAFAIFEELKEFADFSRVYPWSRLLIEVNRSLHHPQLLSSISKAFSQTDKRILIEQYYQPYRDQIQHKIAEYRASGESVLHLSVHSFTPVLKGVKRNAEIGLLYDPVRRNEQEWAKELKKAMNLHLPELKIRMNYPYLGKADGFTTSLRRVFTVNYSGIEIELNQQLFKNQLELVDLKQAFCLIIKTLKNK